VCEQHDIGWVIFPSGRGFCGLAYPDLWEIETPEIKGRLSYAIALHEIGHLLGPYQRPRYKCLMNEIGAWKWARRNALIWSPGMERLAQGLVAWYASVDSQHGITNAELENRKWTARQVVIEAYEALKEDEAA